MSDSENLFRVTKHINTFIISKDCSMRVYDIVKLKEALDIRSVSGGFEIFDTETGRRAPGTIIYPDEGSAETSRDRLRAAASRPASTSNTPSAGTASGSTVGPANAAARSGTPNLDDLNPGQRRQLRRRGSVTFGGETYTKQEIETHTERERIANNRATRAADASRGTPQTTAGSDSTNAKSAYREKFRAVRRVLGTAGGIVLTVAMWNEIEATMADLVERRSRGEFNEDPKKYEEAVSAAFGSFVAVAAPTVISTIGTSFRAIKAALSKLNATSSLAMFAGGPLGLFAGVIKFIIWEAGTWAAVYAITQSDTLKGYVGAFIFSTIGKAIFQTMDMSAQFVANVDNIVKDAMNPDTSGETVSRVNRDVRRLAGLNPDDIASRRQGAEPLPNPARGAGNATPTRTQSSSSGAEPLPQNTTSGSNPLVNPALR